MATTTAMSSSSGQVRRNFSLNNGSYSYQRKKERSAARAFFIVLIALVAALSTLAVHLSRQVMQQQQQSSSFHNSNAVERSVIGAASSSEAANAELVHANTQLDDADGTDRVYCMVPFIWNEEIYNAIMDTWGKRCDVINFLTDSIVGGKLKGDKISDDPKMEYKPYWEYPENTFPDNVIFINMTRTWNDCPADKKGVKKVCRHIWEKM